MARFQRRSAAPPAGGDGRRAARRLAAPPTRSSVDSIWVWDHFFPLYGNPDANHYEAYTLLAAMAAETKPRAARRAGDLQLVPQPAAARRHGPHDRPDQRRPLRPRHRVGLVRARLHRVRLRVRHRAARLRDLGAALPMHHGPARAADPAAAGRPPDPDRRQRREGHAAARRAARRRVEHVRPAGELRGEERGPRRLVRQARPATRARSSAPSRSSPTRSRPGRSTSTPAPSTSS